MMLGGINPCIPQQFLDDLMLSVETSPRCSVVFLVATVGKYIREYVCIYIYVLSETVHGTCGLLLFLDLWIASICSFVLLDSRKQV